MTLAGQPVGEVFHHLPDTRNPLFFRFFPA